MSTSSPFYCSVSGMNKVSAAPSQVIPTTFSISSSFTQLEIKPHECDQQSKEDLALSPEHLEDFEEQPLQSKGLLTTVLIRQDYIVHDLFLVYKDNIDDITHMNFILVDGSAHTKEGQEVKEDGKMGTRISLKGLLSRFWKCCSELFFEGDEQKVPKTEISAADAENVPYKLGKILRHGLMACGYWPIILSIPCAVFILTGKRCSESLLHDCMRKVMFEFEVKALEDLQDAAAHEGTFADGKGPPVHPFDVVKMEERMSLVLRLYGGEHCKVPEKQEIGKFMKELASYYLHFRPYWWLREMRRGFLSLETKTTCCLSWRPRCWNCTTSWSPPHKPS
ncbi:uncharacterized protein LOC112566747 [Pomacea canaliculata]|uniref:uncharacterized protein LOC112566747 n=1 Tax=Pomacea canaliculata TaxID=400727 RepID=UPI000D73A924|nr:uncharacterized protein LOC112566747 [Pomacea canaliculata]